MPAQGGTELTKKWLYENVDSALLSQVNIVSRPDDFQQGEKNILWVHDLPADMPFMASPKTRNEFSGIVFVSSWQQMVFFMNMGVSYSESTVIRNAINPIKEINKINDGTIRLVYHPTPHRGLEILVPIFIELCKMYPNLYLDVFSNFDLYDRPQMNDTYEHLYESCRNHPNITYHGTQDNDTVRKALANAHIFAYPCIWRETSCICALEAMSAKCLIVAPDYAALPETVGLFGMSYPWTEDIKQHSKRFSDKLVQAIDSLSSNDILTKLKDAKRYVDSKYDWNTRKHEWEIFLQKVINEPKPKKKAGLQWN